MADTDSSPIPATSLWIPESGSATECEWAPHPTPSESGLNLGVLDANHPEARKWLRSQNGIDPLAKEAMLNQAGRPSTRPFGDRLLVTLRGVNLSAGADPEDMVTLRIWLDINRVLIVHHQPVRALHDLLSYCKEGKCSGTPDSILSTLVGALLDRMQPFLEGLDDRLDAAEDAVIDPDVVIERGDLITIRRQIIAMRRYLHPQREALARLYQETFPVLGDRSRLVFREKALKMTRLVEDLDAAKDRAAVAQEELSSQLAEGLNERMYLFTVVAGIFLPLSFLTGLFGINVAGMPWLDDTNGFWLVGGMCLGIALVSWLLLRRRNWV